MIRTKITYNINSYKITGIAAAIPDVLPIYHTFEFLNPIQIPQIALETSLKDLKFGN